MPPRRRRTELGVGSRFELRLLIGLLIALVLPQFAIAKGEGEAVQKLLAADPGGKRAEPGDEALDALLAESHHDAWLLAEHFLASGRRDLAVRLAGRTDEKAIGPLPSYVEASGASEGGVARADALAAALRSMDAGEYEDALDQLERVRAVPGRVGVFGARASNLAGNALLALDRSSESIEAWLEGGEEALAIGWWHEADEFLVKAVRGALAAQSLDLLARGAEGVRALREVFGEPLFLASAVHNLGSIAHWRGDLPGALRHLNEAVSLFESLHLDADAVEVRSERSWILAQTGDFRAALDEQRLLARYFEDRPRDAAWASNQVYLGLIRRALGDEAGAFEALTQALERYRSLGDALGEAHAGGNLGLAHLMAGHVSEAIENWRASLVLLEAQGDTFNLATVSNDIAVALRQGAEADLALAAQSEDPAEREALRARAKAALEEGHALIQTALSLAEETGASGVNCTARHTLGGILLAEDRPAEVIRLLEPARVEARRLRTWQAYVSITVMLARARLRTEDWYGALREVRTATDELAGALGSLADADMARARSLASDVYDLGVTAAIRAKSEEDLLHFLEAGRAAGLLRGLGGRAAALQATVPEGLMQRLEETTRAKLKAFGAWRDGRKKKFRQARALKREYEALRLEEQEVLDEIGQAQAEAATQLAPSRLVAIRDVQRRLRATARPGLHQVFALFNFQGAEASALLIEKKSTRVVRYPSRDLEPLREAFATLSAAREGDLDAGALATVKRLLIDPLKIPDGPTRLFVSPDRDLAYIPLSVILPDDWELVWEPSATVYDLLAERRLRRGQGILGLGDPDYQTVADPDALTTRGGPRLVPLPGTRLEVEAITMTSEDRRLLSKEATELGLRTALEARDSEGSWKSVHLACHGLVDVELPALSCLAITPGDGEDGFLSAGEILRLPIRADLAVLSACQTGRGKYVRGEGVMSLTRAFMYSGAPRVIVSLWDVNDDATAFLMKTFYGHWKAGRGTAEALRLAQLAVRDHEVEETVRKPDGSATPRAHKPWADPKYWAAWVLWGLPD